MFDTITVGTRRVLDFAASAGTRRLLFVSSGAVYGAQPPELTHVNEDYRGAPDSLDPRSAYGEGKRVAEWLCALAGQEHNLEIPVARCFAFVGPRLPLDAHFAVGNFIRDALAGAPIHIAGDGTPFRSYLYAADLAVWLWTLLLRGSGARAYNVGSPVGLSIAEVAETVRNALGVSAPVRIASPAPAPVRFPARYVPDVTRAAQELGLRPLIDLAEGVRRTAQWARATTRA
jgi:dTDP-glucose 4,6-dehydratase